MLQDVDNVVFINRYNETWDYDEYEMWVVYVHEELQVYRMHFLKNKM